MTLEAWVKAAATPSNDGQIIAKSDSASGWQLKTTADAGPQNFNVTVTNSSGARTKRFSNTARALNTWYHVAGVYDASGRTLTIYINGVLENGTLQGTVPTANLNAAVNANIGRRTGGYYFNGIIDEIRIYNRALSATEVQSDMNTPLGSGTTPPVDTQAPTAPVSLTATAASSSAINLNWSASTDNVGVTGYLVERCQGSGCTSFTQVAMPTTTSFSNTGLTASTSYSYRVRAIDAAGNLSSYSATASATTASSTGGSDVQPPTAPSNLAAAPSGSAIQLNWNASTDNVGVSGYTLERCQGAGCTNFAPVNGSQADSGTGTGPITRPLAASSSNPNYFVDGNGTPVSLNGSHTWNNFQDWGTNGTPQTLDFNAYVNFLAAHGQNFTILWRTELTKFCGLPTTATAPPDITVTSQPWQRTGPGNASDGKLKFDLTKLDQSYFDRLRARVVALNNAGIYTGVYMFTGEWLASFRCSGDGYPFTGVNNINGIDDGYPDSKTSSMTMSAPNAITAFQDAYVEKVIDTLNDLPNVLWIISEEAAPDTMWWENHQISHIHSYEASKPSQHAVGFGVMNDFNDTTITNSDADWISPDIKVSPTSSCGSGTPRCKVNINDSDHSNFGMWNASDVNNRAYAWQNFMNGNQVAFMDPYVVNYPRENRNNCTSPVNGICSAPAARWDNFRDNLGYIVKYSRKLNLANVTTQSSLCSQGPCLAQTPSVGAEYLVYALSGGTFTVNLAAMPSSRTLSVEWLNPSTGAVTTGAPVAAGATRSFTAPFSGDAVLYLVDSAGHAGSTNQTFQTEAVSTGTSYMDSSVVTGVTYNYRVRATDTSGNTSSYSNTASASVSGGGTTGDTQSPTAPANLNATASSSNAVSLSWTAATDNVGVTGYRIERCQGVGCSTFAQIGTSTGTTYNDSTVAASTSYGYRVRATDAAGNLGSYSNVGSTTTPAAQGSTTGAIAVYAMNEGSGSTIGDASGNNITGTIQGATWTTSGKYSSALTFNGTSSAVDLGNPSALQMTGSMTLEAWVKTSATKSTDGQIISKDTGADGWQLKTTSDTGANSFGLAISTGSGHIQRYSKTAPAVNTWYHVAGVYNASTKALDIYVNGVLDDGTLRGTIPATQHNSTTTAKLGTRTGGYFFQGTMDELRVYNRALTQAEIQSDMNTPIGAGSPAPVDTQAPSAPSSLAATAISGTQVNLSWTASTDNAGVTGYRLERCAGSGCSNFAQIATPTATTYNDTALTAGTVYSYRVRATDAAGNLSAYSNVATATTTAAAPTAPTITQQPASKTVTVGQTATFTVSASGTAPFSYQWQKGTTNIANATSSSYTTPATTSADNGSQFRVIVTNAGGNATSNPATLTVTAAATAVDVLTYHNDIGRTGANTNETTLTTTNVNSSTFGKIGNFSVDAKVDAQPLYASNVSTSSGTHNLLIAVTENNTIYAFDANSGAIVWQKSMSQSGETASDDRGCSQVSPKMGITSTPVIDRGRGPNGAIYLVAMSKNGSTYHQRLHALDLATGAELFNGPKEITAQYPGTGDGSNGTNVVFNPAQYKERMGLLLMNGTLYTAWASHCDITPYTGWVMAHNADTLAATAC